MAGAAFVVVVEDEPDLRDAVVEYLRFSGLDAVGVSDGRALREAVLAREPRVVVLDIALPGEDGLSLCRWVRRETAAGVIMATGAGAPLDRVVGLEIGADDYIVKPYELRELLARIRSVARRLERMAAHAPQAGASQAGASQAGHASKAELAPRAVPLPATQPVSGTPDDETVLAIGPYRLFRRARRLVDAQGREVPTTATEYNLLLAFGERPRRILTRADLSERVQGRAHDPDDRSIDIAITRLRKKIEVDPSRPQIIRTVRGEGYRLDPDGN